MKIIVTGGAGFIGSHIANRLIEEHEVHVLDDLSGGFADNLDKRITLHVVDCRDEDAVEASFQVVKPEVVYHLAANAAEGKSFFSPIDITSRSYDATVKVLTNFIKHGGKKFIFTSSIAVYGALQTPFLETDRPMPEDLYGIAKLASEDTIKAMSSVFDFGYVILRPHNVYGPLQNMTDPYRNVVTIWMNNALNDEPVTIYGDGSMERCFSYIDDVVDVLHKCLDTSISNMTLNVGSDVAYRIDELADAIDDLKRVERTYLPTRAHEVKSAIADHTLLRRHIGYHETPLVEGIRKTWEWAVTMGPQERVYAPMEITNSKTPKNWI